MHHFVERVDLRARRGLIGVIAAAMTAGIVGAQVTQHEPRRYTVAGIVLLAALLLALAPPLSNRLRGLWSASVLLAQAVLLAWSFDGRLSVPLLALCVICLAALYEDGVVMVFTVVASAASVAALAAFRPALLNLDGAGDVKLWTTVLLGSVISAVAAIAVAILWLDARRAAAETQDHVRTIETYLEVAGSMLLVLDRDAVVLSANRQTCLVLEREMEDIVGRNWLEFSIPADAVATTTAAYRHAVDHDQIQAVYENELIAATGERREISWHTIPRRNRDGQVTGMVCSGTDITEQRRAERSVERGRLELESLTRLARQVASLDDARQAIVRAAKELVGASYVAIAEPNGQRDALEYKSVTDERYRDFRVPLGPRGGRVARAFESGKPQFTSDVHRATSADLLVQDTTGITAALHQPIVGAGGVIGVLSVAWDHELESVGCRQAQLVGIIAHEAAVALRRRDSLAALSRAALVDPLTGIANRRAFDAELPQALRRTEQTGQPLALIVMDLNEFKAVNDTQGHEAGDELLAACAAAWAGALRAGDMLARIGGDEFIALLPGCSPPEMRAIIERLRSATPHPPGTSIGGATWDGSQPASDLIRNADEAQYADKARSKTGRGGPRRTTTSPACEQPW